MNSGIIVNISSQEAQRLIEANLNTLTGRQIKQSISRSINYTLARSKTTINRGIRERYNMTLKSAAGEIKNVHASVDKQTGEVKAEASRTLISKFNPSITSAGGIRSKFGAKGVVYSIKTRNNGDDQLKVSIIKGETKSIRGAFTQLLPNGLPTIFARGKYEGNAKSFVFRHFRIQPSGSNDTPIQPLTTLSVFTAIVEHKPQIFIAANLGMVYQKRLEHEITEGFKHT